MLTIHEFMKNFPPATTLPPAILQLLDYQNAVPDFYSGSFELDHSGAESAYYWFDCDEQAARQFAIFGHGGDGSLYAYWLYPNQTLFTAPIVFLDSEGIGTTVLATHFEAFLALLSLGYTDLGFAVSKPEYSIGTRIDEALLHFRAWLAREFQIQVPNTHDAIVSAAQNAHPDLEIWIEQWRQQHFGGTTS